MINFNVPPFIGTEMDYIKKAVENNINYKIGRAHV